MNPESVESSQPNLPSGPPTTSQLRPAPIATAAQQVFTQPAASSAPPVRPPVPGRCLPADITEDAILHTAQETTIPDQPRALGDDAVQDDYALSLAQEIMNNAVRASGREPIFPDCEVFRDGSVTVRFLKEKVIISGLEPNKVAEYIASLQGRAKGQTWPLPRHRDLIARLDAKTATTIPPERETEAKKIGHRVATDFLSKRNPTSPGTISDSTAPRVHVVATTSLSASPPQKLKPWNPSRLGEMSSALDSAFRSHIRQMAIQPKSRRATPPVPSSTKPQTAAAPVDPYPNPRASLEGLRECFKSIESAEILRQELQKWRTKCEKGSAQDDRVRECKVQVDAILRYFTTQEQEPGTDAEQLAKEGAQIALNRLHDGYQIPSCSINDLTLKLKGKSQ